MGLHAIQGIPVVGYLVQRVPAGRAIVWAPLGVWTAVTTALFLLAIQGRPVLPL
jgi:hypothetical protein